MLEDIVEVIKIEVSGNKLYTQHTDTTKMRRHLPEEYEYISSYMESLPFHHQASIAPFGGFVLNIRACTKAHWDHLDAQNICVLLFLGNWKGGDLILYEPSLRFTVSRGDILMFPSAKIMHFNMHYEGLRLTLVFHTDRDSKQWMESRNGWCKATSKMRAYQATQRLGRSCNTKTKEYRD